MVLGALPPPTPPSTSLRPLLAAHHRPPAPRPGARNVMGGRYKISAARNRESSVCACECVRERGGEELEREGEAERSWRERKGGNPKAKSKGMSKRGER